MSSVLVQVPSGLSSTGVEIAVRHLEWGVEVDVRPLGTAQSWTPLQHLGGRWEERP